jgi:signal transduction histidine kinase
MASSHEMRTYITAIKWILSMMQKGDLGSLNTEQMEMISKAKDSNDRMLVIIEKILNTLRSNKIAEDEQKTNFNILGLIQETISLHQIGASAKGVNIVSSFNTGEIIFNGKKSKIYSLLHNLIENAIKYSDPNSTVEIVCEKKSDEIVMSIKNTGKTIPMEEQSHIFERFFRGSNAEGGRHGFGIGLYTAKEAVASHGGTITFSSQNNQTIFTIKMPVLQV